jgi:hypothetical protein
MILKSIIDRLNQRVEVSNIFDRIYGLCELTGDKGWIYYIGDGQAIPVTDYDSKQGTLFWAKRGKVNISKIDSLRVSGCKQMYSTKFNLSAYAIVRKSHLPCDGEDAGDWVASRVYKLVSGRDYGFKDVIDVVSYEVIPNGYTVGDKTLPPNFEFATVVIELEVEIVSGSEDTCYDICNTGDIPLPPDFLPCTPCLTEVAVDGVTIIGNGTPSDPLIAVGGGGGGGTLLALPFTNDHLSSTGNQYLIGNVVWYNGNVYRCIANNDSILPTNATYWVNLGAGFPLVEQPSNWNATSGNNQILNKPTIPAAQVNSDWNAISGVAEILNKPTIPVLPATIVEDVTATAPLSSSGGATPDISITQASASTDGYLSATDFNTFDGKQDALTAGTGIDLTGNIVTNTAPDQIVSITGGTDITVSGTYPSFTIDSTATGGMQGGQASGTDTYTVSIPGVTGYNLNDAYAIGFTNANTGASTININGLGAVNIAKNNTVPIIGGDIAANQQFVAIYDGTNFQILGVAPNQMFAYITNADSVTINRGQPVYAFGATGDRMTVKLADNTTEATSSKTVGLVFSSSIAPNQKGYIITQGVIDGINTGMFTAGDTLYVGNSPGAKTNVLPLAPNHLTRIGIVERANAGNGQIYVLVQNGFQLDELSDVDITTVTPVNNDFLVYTTGVNNLWKNRSLGNVLGGTTSQYVRGDGTLATMPISTFKSTTDSATITGTTNQLVQSQIIAANTYAVGDIIRLTFRTQKSTITANMTVRVYINTANNLTGANLIATFNSVGLYGQIERRLFIKSATATQSMLSTFSFQSDIGTTNGITNTNIDWTQTQYIILAAQQTTGTDTTLVSGYLIEKL